MFASCASAVTLAANAWSFFANVSGLSMRTSNAPAATSWPSFTAISATRPSTRAAMSNRVASASPCTSRGCGPTKYQADRPTTAAITTPTMMDETLVDDDARSFGTSCGCADWVSVCMADVGVSIPASPLWPSENSILASLTAENFSFPHQIGARPTSSVHDELQQGFAVGGMGFQGS